MPADFPQISYRPGAAGRLAPTVRGTGIRVQTIVVASETEAEEWVGQVRWLNEWGRLRR